MVWYRMLLSSSTTLISLSASSSREMLPIMRSCSSLNCTSALLEPSMLVITRLMLTSVAVGVEVERPSRERFAVTVMKWTSTLEKGWFC